MRSPRLTHPIPAHVCVVCVFQREVILTYTFISQVSEKKTTILTYHHNVHKAKVCFGMVFFVHLNGQRNVFSTWKQISETCSKRKRRLFDFQLQAFDFCHQLLLIPLCLSRVSVFAKKDRQIYMLASKIRRTCRLEEEPTGPLIIFTFFWEGIIEHTPLLCHNIGEI